MWQVLHLLKIVIGIGYCTKPQKTEKHIQTQKSSWSQYIVDIQYMQIDETNWILFILLTSTNYNRTALEGQCNPQAKKNKSQPSFCPWFLCPLAPREVWGKSLCWSGWTKRSGGPTGMAGNRLESAVAVAFHGIYLESKSVEISVTVCFAGSNWN